jgi:hypothetical protein
MGAKRTDSTMRQVSSQRVECHPFGGFDGVKAFEYEARHEDFLAMF